MDKRELKKVFINMPSIKVSVSEVINLIDQLDEPKPQLSGKYELKEFLDRVLDERHFDSFNEIYDDIISFIDDQLDEPEKVNTTNMTKEEMMEKYGMSQEKWNELIERYKWHLEYDGYTVTKKPVIPAFVGEWIETNKDLVSLVEAAELMSYRGNDEDLNVLEWAAIDSDTFARAWLDGYKVEEKKYQVIIGGYVLRKFNNTNKFQMVTKGSPKLDNLNGCKINLTEQEIKDIDPRLWSLAEEVTE